MTNDGRYEESCENCGAIVEAFTERCPGCGFNRRTFEHTAPECACIECGEYSYHRCGCCGFPLCGMHHELGAGFCSKNLGVGGVPVCAYGHTVFVGVHGPEDVVLIDDGDDYHLPDERGESTTACDPDDSGKDAVPLTLATENGRGLCEDCADEARERHEKRKRELAEDFEGGGQQ